MFLVVVFAVVTFCGVGGDANDVKWMGVRVTVFPLNKDTFRGLCTALVVVVVVATVAVVTANAPLNTC